METNLNANARRSRLEALASVSEVRSTQTEAEVSMLRLNRRKMRRRAVHSLATLFANERTGEISFAA